MSNTLAVLRGIIHGKTIELDEEPGLPDGQTVTVTLQSLQEQIAAPGDGIRRSAGGWAEDAEGLEEFLQWNRRRRKIGRREGAE